MYKVAKKLNQKKVVSVHRNEEEGSDPLLINVTLTSNKSSDIITQ